jgi:peptide/nickel transport system ATP-binding protein
MQDQVEKVMVMYGGNIVESAKTNDLFSHHKHPYTQGLFASRPRMGLARGTRLATIPGVVPQLKDLPAGCAFADRCSKVMAECRMAMPALKTTSDNHAVGCHLF